jgi:hypothetical protein
MESIIAMAFALSDKEKLELIRILAASIVQSEYTSGCNALLEELRDFQSELTYDQVWGE